jgi:hypothetical protein
MKKLFLSVCLLALSAQASQNWQAMPHGERAEKYAREYFELFNPGTITREDIRQAIKKFPTFLEWRFLEDSKVTIVHLVAFGAGNPDVLFYLLGFSPDLTVVDDRGRSPKEMCRDQNFTNIFELYEKIPWRHPPNGVDLPVNHQSYLFDGKRFGEDGLLGALDKPLPTDS